MFNRSTLLHLRIPFSFFLLPVFLFALAIVPDTNVYRAIIIFLSLHVFLYPASNGYNSYFDKDEKSIGGLKHPPKVTSDLYRWALVFDVIAIGLGLLINTTFAIMLVIYGLVSKAYSHPSIRLKKYGWLSWVIAGFFQGAFTFWMAYIGLTDGTSEEIAIHWQPALLTSAILWGSYPMTQIYQHEEDKKRGDITLSYKLGIRGTFLFTLLMFSIASGFFWIWFYQNHGEMLAWYFVVAMMPIVLYFNSWFLKVLKDESKADFDHTMRLNFLSSLMLNAFFVFLYFQLH